MGTPHDITAAMTERGGWPRATLSSWGVPWPPPKGWQQRLLSGGTPNTTITTVARPARVSKSPRARRAPQPTRSERYNAFLLSHPWKTLRQAVLARDGHSCVACASNQHLHCHHLTYRRFGGAELLTDLVTLCEPCHDALHTGYQASPDHGNRHLTRWTKEFIAARQDTRKIES